MQQIKEEISCATEKAIDKGVLGLNMNKKGTDGLCNHLKALGKKY